MDAHIERLISAPPSRAGLATVVRLRLLSAPPTGAALARRLARAHSARGR